jgi:two-component system, cell cycle response regulator DivK
MAGERVLVVDDNPLNLKLMQVLLRIEGYDVRTSADATEALVVLQAFGPRVIVMDIQLPGIDGLELTRRLKGDRSTQHILIIALTAYAMIGDETTARAAGCDAYVTKPLDTTAFTGMLAELLAASDRPA